MSWESPVRQWKEINSMHSEKQVHREGNEDGVYQPRWTPRGDAACWRWWIACHEYDSETGCEAAQLEMSNPAVYVLNKGKFKYNKLIFHFIFNTAERMSSWLISFYIYCLWSGCSVCLIFSLCILQQLTPEMVSSSNSLDFFFDWMKH